MTEKTIGRPGEDLDMAEREKLRAGMRDGDLTPVDEGTTSKSARRKLKFDAIKDEAARVAASRLTGDLFELEVLEKRRAGEGVAEIASFFGRKPEEIKSVIDKCLQKYMVEMAESVEQVRNLELFRLDGMLEKLWKFRDDPRTVDSILKVMDRRAKLMGLDAVQKTELALTGLENLTDEQIRARLANLAAAASETPGGGGSPDGGASSPGEGDVA